MKKVLLLITIFMSFYSFSQETSDEDGQIMGWSSKRPEYVKARADNDSYISREFQRVRIESLEDFYVQGTLIPKYTRMIAFIDFEAKKFLIKSINLNKSAFKGDPDIVACNIEVLDFEGNSIFDGVNYDALFQKKKKIPFPFTSVVLKVSR